MRVKKLVLLHHRPNVVQKKQGSLHLGGRMRGARKLVQENKLRIGTWNVGTLTGKLMEAVDTMLRRKMDILCLQETKWCGEKAKEVERT